MDLVQRILGIGFLGLISCAPRNLQVKSTTSENKDIIHCYDNPNNYNDNSIIHCYGILKEGTAFTFQRNLISGPDGLNYTVDILSLFNKSGLSETYLDADNHLGPSCPTLENPLLPQISTNNGLCEPASINSPVEAMGSFRLLPYKFEFNMGSGTYFGTDKYLEIKNRIYPLIPYGPFNRYY